VVPKYLSPNFGNFQNYWGKVALGRARVWKPPAGFGQGTLN